MDLKKFLNNQSTSNVKISVGVIIVFIITFSALIISNNSDYTFYSETDFSKQQTIFLIGSSHTGKINVTQVNEQISSGNISVYNLARNMDIPELRLMELEQIISAEPEIVFYGISHRDFRFPFTAEPQSVPPDTSKLISRALNSNFQNIFPSNPHMDTIQTMTEMLEKIGLINPRNFKVIPQTPFIEFPSYPIINSNDELKKQVVDSLLWTDYRKSELNIVSLKTIISKLQDNGIKIVFFTTPLHKYNLEVKSDYQKESFSKLKEDLKKNYGVKIYEFEGKYTELNIWDSIDHVSTHNNVTIYNNDIAKMIIAETRG